MPTKLNSKPKVRLPKSIMPIKYNLQIQPDIEASTFIGNEVIDILLEKSVKEVSLHSKELEITDGWWQVGKEKVDILKISYNEKADTATFQFAKSLPKGKGKLHLHFRGIISDKLRGFYRSQYEYKGKTMRIATTQFESTDARRAFPCFDEPSHKAVFQVSLVIPKHLTAISNTIELPESSATPQGVDHKPGYKVINFAPTPKMSTYLLAYIIGDFEYIETKTKAKGQNGVTIRIFTTPGKKHQAKFALEVAKKSLEFLNDYFKVPYPLPILDLIAIPDFSAGAMENWGAVTFRESALLADENHTAFANRQQIAETIAHELVHQWFGNLVTMEWWTHLWLNESFASFMSYLVLEDLFPQWHIWTRFVMNDHANALQLDSLENTHPIEVEVHHPNQISEIFDAISYDKGASVLRMLMHYIGPENFRNGLSYYLKKHSYKNTESIHLWDAFEKASGKPVSKFMAKWVGNSGYPIVTLVEPKIGQLHISQKRFVLGSKKDKHKDKTVWQIPLQFELDKGHLSDLDLFSQVKKQITISPSSKYIKANPQETGFFRTLYSPSLLAKLYEPIKSKELSSIDRFGVVRDLFAMSRAGHIPVSAFLEFIKAYENEDSYIIWTEILSGMREVYELLDGQPQLQKKLAKYYLKVLKVVAKKVGWEIDHKESQTKGLLRSAVLAQYGFYGDKATIEKAKKVFSRRNSKPIHPDLRAAVYSLVALNGDASTHATFQKMYISETLNEEQRRIGKALTMFSNKNLYVKSLDFAISKNVRSQDAAILIYISLLNFENKDLAWKWIQKNWKTLYDRYHGDHLIVWIVKSLGAFNTTQKAKEIEAFFKKNPAPSAQRAVKQVKERITLKAEWIKRDKKDLANCINNSLEL